MIILLLILTIFGYAILHDISRVRKEKSMIDPHRLRELAKEIEPHMYGLHQVIPQALINAADEIERLNKELESYQTRLGIIKGCLVDVNNILEPVETVT